MELTTPPKTWVCALESTLGDVVTIKNCGSGGGYGGVAEGAELLSHLTTEERESVLRTQAAGDLEDLEQFARSARTHAPDCSTIIMVVLWVN